MLQELHGLKVAEDEGGEGGSCVRSLSRVVAIMRKGPCGVGTTGMLALLVGRTVTPWACPDMMTDTVLLPSQLSGADPECSCDEGDETSRKKRSRSL